MANSSENWYLSLLGLAENFRTANPPNIKLCIHCLQTIFHFKPPPRIEARTLLQLGSVLYSHTTNVEYARNYLERAWMISQSMPSFEEVRFETASLLANIYESRRMVLEAKSLLQKSIETSDQVPFWHCRLLFQLAQIYSQEQNYVAACALLGQGADYCTVRKAEYTKILFLLSKGMLLLVDKKLGEVHTTLSLAGTLIEAWNAASSSQKETLKVFFLVLQVSHYLMGGQVKTVKTALKQLQQSTQQLTALSSDDEFEHAAVTVSSVEHFHWMSKEHLVVLIYLVTVMHSMQAGFMDKAQKYTDKALMQIEKLKLLDSHPLLLAFQLMLLENIVMCRLVVGNKTRAVQEIVEACHVCHQQPRLFHTHRAQLHTLLGLYAMSMNCLDSAEAQFKTALSLSRDQALCTFVSLNLAIVFIRLKRHAELMALLESLDLNQLAVRSHSLQASMFCVRGLQAFFQAEYPEAKHFLRETLKIANDEDLNRLTSCALVLLGHIFLSLGNSQEALNMVLPALQLAGKIPDVHIQLWASALLRDLYKLSGDRQGEAEGYKMHDSFTQALLKDHFQASQLAEHRLIQWTDGPCPLAIQQHASTMSHPGIM